MHFSVQTHQPVIQVIVTKNIYRQNGVSQRSRTLSQLVSPIDVTPYLGDSGEVTVTKSLYSHAGSFQLQFVDRGHLDIDSLYGLIEPMDHVEISFARNQHEYGAELPVVMRGFVRHVRRSEVMTQNGRPSRVVTVTGNDYGCVFDLFKIVMFRQLVAGDNILARFSRMLQLKQEYKPYIAADFMAEFVDLANENYLDVMLEEAAKDGGQGLNYRIGKDLKVNDTLISNIFMDQFEGPLWAAMMRNADTPWNELFVEDRADGPYLVYRPAPWLDLNGEPVLKGRSGVMDGVEFIPVDIKDVTRLDVDRSDSLVFNLYKIDAARISYELQSQVAQAAMNANSPNVYIKNYENVDPKMYGDRLTHAETAHVPIGWLGRSDGSERAVWEANTQSFMEYLEEKRRELAAMNLDNVVLEDGSMQIKGNERIRVGNYVRLHRGGLIADYYINTLVHRFAPFRHFTTTANFIRGTGFVARNRLERAPHFIERTSWTAEQASAWTSMGARIDYDAVFKKEGE